MTAAICVIGRKNSGKTTLIEQLVRELAARGRRVATVKHDAHDFEIDVPGKDTWRHRQAGSRTTIIASASKIAMISTREGVPEVDELLRLIDRSYDLVLVEGFRMSRLPNIVVERTNEDEPTREFIGDVWAVVTDKAPSADSETPRFRPDETERIADLIEQRLLGGPIQSPLWDLPSLLAEAGRQHGHLCPGQVLGVRLAVLGCEGLGIYDPKTAKRLITFVETDRCGTNAVQSVTGCTLGKRTLKFVDYGKLAATFLDTKTGRALRVCARESARETALRFAPDEADPHRAQLRAYKALAAEKLFTVQEVRVQVSASDLPGRPSRRLECEACGEGVNDGREVSVGGRTLCRACSDGAYYAPLQAVPR